MEVIYLSTIHVQRVLTLSFKNHLPLSISTSSKTTIGLFPPSSSETGCQTTSEKVHEDQKEKEYPKYNLPLIRLQSL